MICSFCTEPASVGCNCEGTPKLICAAHLMNHYSYRPDLIHIFIPANQFMSIDSLGIQERVNKLQGILMDLDKHEKEADDSLNKTKEVHYQIISGLNYAMSTYEETVEHIKAQCSQKREEISKYMQDTSIDIQELLTSYDQSKLASLINNFGPVHMLEASNFLHMLVKLEVDLSQLFRVDYSSEQAIRYLTDQNKQMVHKMQILVDNHAKEKQELEAKIQELSLEIIWNQI